MHRFGNLHGMITAFSNADANMGQTTRQSMFEKVDNQKVVKDGHCLVNIHGGISGRD